MVGGGPAGSAVAWHLATAGAAVTLVHDHRDRWRPVGQQLSAAARPLLQTMGVLDAVTAESVPVHEARSAWVGPEIDSRPAIISPYGPPLAVERPRLDVLLRTTAQDAGAHLVRGHARAFGGTHRDKATAQRPAGDSWIVEDTSGTHHRAGLLVDATGSSRAVSRTVLPWTCHDRLRCAVWKATPADPAPQAWSLVEAVPDGWWYTAPAPGAEVDRLTVMRVGDLSGTNEIPGPPVHTARRLGRPLPTAADYRIATIGHASPPWAPRLITVGDAAVAVDPLSSSGLHNALRLAEPAAAAALALLDGDTGPAHRYAQKVHAIADDHLNQRRHYLKLTGASDPFWTRHNRPVAGPGVLHPVRHR